MEGCRHRSCGIPRHGRDYQSDRMADSPWLEEMRATADEIIAAVKQSDKQRFELSTHPGQQMLRATQGHSFAVDRNLVHKRVEPSGLPEALFHGTTATACKDIEKTGLLAGGPKRSREDIHMVAQLPGAGVTTISGMRSNANIAPQIAPREAAATEGIQFFVSSNAVYLTEGLRGIPPARYIRAVIILQTGEVIKATDRESAPKWGALRAGLRRAQESYMSAATGHVAVSDQLLTSRLMHTNEQDQTRRVDTKQLTWLSFLVLGLLNAVAKSMLYPCTQAQHWGTEPHWSQDLRVHHTSCESRWEFDRSEGCHRCQCCDGSHSCLCHGISKCWRIHWSGAGSMATTTHYLDSKTSPAARSRARRAIRRYDV